MTAEPFIAFATPSITEDDIDAVADVLRSGWLTTGERAEEFERAIADYVGAEAGLALSSATAGLHLSLLAHGIQPGDVVAVSPLTFCSAINVIEHIGARPRFVDVDPVTLNMDLGALADAIDAEHGALKAIQPVHLYGYPVDGPSVGLLATANGAVVVADAAHAIGGARNGVRVGASNEFGGAAALSSFSFYATKNITSGEGGMIVGPQALVDVAREWSLHGMTKDAYSRHRPGASWMYDVMHAGYKYNLSDVAAALGLAQLARFEAMQSRRHELAALYLDGLSDLDLVELPTVGAGVVHAWQIFAIRLHLERLSIDRAGFAEELCARGIGTGVHFIPVPSFTHYRQRYGDVMPTLPVTAREAPRLLSLPLHPGMTDRDAHRVVDAIVDLAQHHRR